jgi:hypothetical protein
VGIIVRKDTEKISRDVKITTYILYLILNNDLLEIIFGKPKGRDHMVELGVDGSIKMDIK